MRETPNFAGWSVTVLHREDSNTERLLRQLRLLGLKATMQWKPITTSHLPDMVIVDADQGFDDLLPWGGDLPTIPVAALLGSEAPGRIAWALKQGASAIIAKPVAASAVYPALVMALSIHEERKAAAAHAVHLEERLRLRPIVHAAVRKIAERHQVDDDRAYGILRRSAMSRRMPMEQLAASILGGVEPLPEAS